MRTPGASVRHVEMIPVFLGRELGARLSGYKVAKRRLSSLEFASIIGRFDPFGDL